MTTKHTPGPWTASNHGVTWRILAGEAGGFSRPIIARTCEAQTDAEAEANARLIAAAPELLAACETALTALDAAHAKLKGMGLIPNPKPDPVRDCLRLAIAIATGTNTHRWPTETELQREADALEAARGGAK